MALVGPRPRSLDDLPPRRVAPLPKAGSCFYCGTDLKTDQQAALHRCDVQATRKASFFGDRRMRTAL